jgi:hypothetical protein
MSPAHRSGELAAESPGQCFDEAVAIGLVVENVGGDSHPAKTGRDMDAFAGKSLDKARRHPIPETKA